MTLDVSFPTCPFCDEWMIADPDARGKVRCTVCGHVMADHGAQWVERDLDG